ncbi:hypothetical protein BDZ89DRAFT_1055435 [Hymenopellis radicata]|nr:hypothetical protein BDZ89DRAFT_1055435 [Hymenopellis radicata]
MNSYAGATQLIISDNTTPHTLSTNYPNPFYSGIVLLRRLNVQSKGLYTAKEACCYASGTAAAAFRRASTWRATLSGCIKETDIPRAAVHEHAWNAPRNALFLPPPSARVPPASDESASTDVGPFGGLRSVTFMSDPPTVAAVDVVNVPATY